MAYTKKTFPRVVRCEDPGDRFEGIRIFPQSMPNDSSASATPPEETLGMIAELLGQLSNRNDLERVHNLLEARGEALRPAKRKLSLPSYTDN